MKLFALQHFSQSWVKIVFQVYQNLNLTDDRKKLENILKALTEHFEPKTNVIYERYVFNTTDQLSSDSVDDYVCRLRELSRSCKYNDMADPVEEMIRDRLVLGTKDNSVRARMLRESNLNLTNAIDMCRTSERTSQQLQKLTPLVTSSVPAQQGVNAAKSHKVSKFKKRFANKSDDSKQKSNHNVVKQEAQRATYRAPEYNVPPL